MLVQISLPMGSGWLEGKKSRRQLISLISAPSRKGQGHRSEITSCGVCLLAL